MSSPDFSRDPETVALAKVLLEANETFNRWNHMPLGDLVESTQRNYLAMADAAITHLGSGYRLPEANEANAERLANTWDNRQINTRESGWLQYLRALNAAFTDPAEEATVPEDDLPFPEFASGTFEQCTATNGGERCELPTGHGGEHSADRLDWEDADQQKVPGPIYTALAGNAHLMEKLFDTFGREERVKAIRYWASIFKEAACRK